MGDNITPPQQAFNWIGDLYSSTEEIKAAGQTIVGLLHEDIGHLGIFVSGAVAKKEHAQIVELLKQIQQLPPGLYGMDIKERPGRRGAIAYDVTIVERTLEDLRKMQKYDRVDEKPFEAVAALSELTERAYELLARPARARAVARMAGASLRRDFHPLRVQRWAFSDRNPWLWWLPYAASVVDGKSQAAPTRATCSPVPSKPASECVSAALDLYRDVRDATAEAAFFQVYGNMLSLNVADQQHVIRRATRFDPRSLPAVKQVLDTLDQGAPAEAYVRIGLLMAKAGGGQAQARADGARARAGRASAAARSDQRGRVPHADARGDDHRRVRTGARASGRCRSSCARRPIGATRTSCSTSCNRTSVSIRSSARSLPISSRCCRSAPACARPRGGATPKRRRRPRPRSRSGARRRQRAWAGSRCSASVTQ